MATPSNDTGTVGIYIDPSGDVRICVKNDRSVGSSGIFYGCNPFHYVLPVTLCQIFIFSILSRVIYFLLKPIKTPKFTCNIMAGILLGPSCLGRYDSLWKLLFPPRQAQFLVLAAFLSIAYFLFIQTVKMDILTTLKAARSTRRLGLIPFLASFAAICILLNLYHDPHGNPLLEVPQSHSTFIGITMSLSYYQVVYDALMEFNLVATELGQIAMSSAMFNDMLQWLIVIGLRMQLQTVIVHISFLFFCLFILRPLMKIIVWNTPVGKPVKEIYVVMILLGVLIITFISDFIGMSTFIGPVIFGFIIPSGAPLGTTLAEKSELIVSKLLLPFFYLFVGFSTNLSALKNFREIIVIQCTVIAGYLAKMLACVMISISYGIKPKNGAVIGLIMNMKGVNELISLTGMKQAKARLGEGYYKLWSVRLKFDARLDEERFTHLVLCVVVMTAIISPIIKLLCMHRPLAQHESDMKAMRVRSIQSTPKNTEFRIIMCLHHEASVRGMIALLEASNPVRESPICVFVVQLIELMGQITPILLPMNYKHKKKLMSFNYPNTNHIMRAFMNYSNNASGPITVLPHINVATYKHMHEFICKLAQDKMVPFIVIPFHENVNVDLRGHMETSIQKLNTKFQARADCTVGILVDRYSRLGANDANLIFHVGIFFIGGKDDREALALGIRMADREDVRVSLFRFNVIHHDNNSDKVGESNKTKTREAEEEEEMEQMLNESMIDEYKSKKYNGCDVSWYEIVVSDEVEILDTIRGLEGSYDLVMVGKRHNIGSMDDEEMANFMENVENLGILGDMLASTEFCMGVVPVLVTQCGGIRHMHVKQLSRVCSAAASQRSLSLNNK
ncbi:hypothetical protein RIF29_08775 [Crotalaria pallida]|uniref:Cation/H+ exchanger transmembrane domain-containing protein n=1 Tax=Crotalaria pallida TaxID=3830 RepID=A0AAN9FTV4_CROPI